MTMPTYDYEVEQANLLRRRKVAEAMLNGGLAPIGPTESIGGIAVKRSPLEAISKIAQAYAGQRQVQSISDDERKLGERYRKDMRADLERFMNTMEGSTTSIPGGEGTDAYGGEVVSKPNPRQAIVEAMASPFPGMQQIGQSYMQQMGKDRVGVKDLLQHASPEAQERMVRSGNTSDFAAKQDLGEVGGMVYDKRTKQVVQIGSAKPWDQVKIDGDLYQINPSTMKLEKLDNAPKVNVSTNVRNVVNAGQKAGMEAWSKQAAGTVDEMAKSARESVKMLTQLTQLDALTKGGTNMGPLADAQTFIQGLANAAGMKVDAGKLNNSQAFNSVATQAWAALMQQNGGARGLVKEESEKLAASLPSLVQTPQGRSQIIAVLRQAAEQNIKDAAKASQEYSQALQTDNPAAFTFGLSSTQLPQSGPNPAAPGSVSPSKPSVSNW